LYHDFTAAARAGKLQASTASCRHRCNGHARRAPAGIGVALQRPVNTRKQGRSLWLQRSCLVQGGPPPGLLASPDSRLSTSDTPPIE